MNSILLNSYKNAKRIPEKLFYLRKINTAMKPVQKEYVMFSPKTGRELGVMHCHKTKYQVRPDWEGFTFAIDYIVTYARNKGHGASLIDFAKNLSRKEGCNSHIYLMADGSFTPRRMPHLFYRKQGFTTLDKKTDGIMDRMIKWDKPAKYTDFPCTLMYYSDEEYKASKKSFFGKIGDLIKNIIK